MISVWPARLIGFMDVRFKESMTATAAHPITLGAQ
jgi:hypothetical protein